MARALEAAVTTAIKKLGRLGINVGTLSHEAQVELLLDHVEPRPTPQALDAILRDLQTTGPVKLPLDQFGRLTIPAKTLAEFAGRRSFPLSVEVAVVAGKLVLTTGD